MLFLNDCDWFFIGKWKNNRVTDRESNAFAFLHKLKRMIMSDIIIGRKAEPGILLQHIESILVVNGKLQKIGLMHLLSCVKKNKKIIKII